MGMRNEIIIPTPGKHPKSIGSRCAMIGNPMDMDCLCDLIRLTRKQSRRLLLSRLYYDHENHPSYSLIGPFMGAPYAVMLLETVISWGVKEAIFFGWCGAVSPDVHIGDIIIPDLAFIDEGTSKNYIEDKIEIKPSFTFQDRLKEVMTEKNIHFHEGPIWSTDAIFRETQAKIKYYQSKHVLGVEMESSALFTVGQFRSIAVGCILVVSDEVSSDKWVKGFDKPRFKDSRKLACEVIRNYLSGDYFSCKS